MNFDTTLMDLANKNAEKAKEEKQVTVHLQNINQRTHKKKEKFNVKRIQKFVIAVGIVGLTSGITYSAVEQRKPINQLERELDIHSYNAYNFDTGEKIEPTLDHDCAIGGPEEGSIGERVIKYANENGITYDELIKAVNEKGTSIMDPMDIKVNSDGTFEYVVPEETLGFSK